MQSKKAAEGIEYVILTLGALVFVTMMFTFSLTFTLMQEENPFFSQPGEREYYLLSLYQAVYAELYKVDLFATYAVSETLSDMAQSMGNVYGSRCGTYLGYPVMNDEDGYCEPDEFRDVYSSAFERNLYEHVITSDIDMPHNYEYSLILSDDTRLEILGHGLDTVKYSLNPKDLQKKLGALSQNLNFAYDISTSCNYLYDNKELVFVDGELREGFECTQTHCTGPCIGNLNIRAVSYFNQCHIVACEEGGCRIDTEEICKYGCNLKSLQMAYAFYDFYFDETQSTYTSNVEDLLVELGNEYPKDTIERLPAGTSDTILSGKNIQHGNKYGSIEVLERVDASHYQQLVNMVQEGLVVIRLRNTGSCPVRNELGYCPNQHFVTVLAANDDFIVIHDPWTPQRPYESGMNVVLSRDFVKELWTGRYVQVMQG